MLHQFDVLRVLQLISYMSLQEVIIDLFVSHEMLDEEGHCYCDACFTGDYPTDREKIDQFEE